MSLDEIEFTPRGREISYADDEISLTNRQLQILTLSAQGWQAKQIAKRLGFMSHRTIELHRLRILTRLRARNVVHAVAIGITQGLIFLDTVVPQEEALQPNVRNGKRLS